MSDWTPPTPPPDVQHGINVALKGAFSAAGEAVADEMGLSFDEIIPEAEAYGAERGAELIGMKIGPNGNLIPNPNAEWAISETTRDEANVLLRDALKEGWSYQDFASRLEESGLFGDARAEMVARSEIAQAMIGGKKSAFAESGDEYGYVYDGDGCPECEARNGTIMEIAEFELLHPNCEGDIRAATRSELIEEGLIEPDEDDAQAEEAA